MSGRTVSGVVPAPLHQAAQQAVDYEGTSMSALVSAALALYLGLPAAARRTARYVLAKGTPEDRAALAAGCGRAIAQAGNGLLTEELAARGRALGLDRAADLSEEALAEASVEAVRQARAAARGAVPETAAAGPERPLPGDAL